MPSLSSVSFSICTKPFVDCTFRWLSVFVILKEVVLSALSELNDIELFGSVDLLNMGSGKAELSTVVFVLEYLNLSRLLNGLIAGSTFSLFFSTS